MNSVNKRHGLQILIFCSPIESHPSPPLHVQGTFLGPGWGRAPRVLVTTQWHSSPYLNLSLHAAFLSADRFVSQLWKTNRGKRWEEQTAGWGEDPRCVLGWLVLCLAEAILPAPCTTKEASQWGTHPIPACLQWLVHTYKWLWVRSFQRLLATWLIFAEPHAWTNFLYVSSHHPFNNTAKERKVFPLYHWHRVI